MSNTYEMLEGQETVKVICAWHYDQITTGTWVVISLKLNYSLLKSSLEINFYLISFDTQN